MMVKVSDEVAAALRTANGLPLPVDVPGADREFLLVDAAQHRAMVEKLAIMEGLADIEEGRTQPIEEASKEIRALLMEKYPDGAPG